jgi:hypothetical protein
VARLKDRVLTPRVARAMTSPLGILAAGVGAALGIAALGPLAAIPGALAGWAVRVAAAVPGGGRTAAVSSRGLEQPWRGYVQRVQSSEARFAAAVARTRPGPLHDRLAEIGERVTAGVGEAWEIARRGQALSEARRHVDTAGVAGELAAARARMPGAGIAGEGIVEALEAQLGSARRLDEQIAAADAKLRLLDARMAEAVARAIELSAPTGDGVEVGALGDDVDEVVTEMELLRQALDEAGDDLTGGISPL